MIFMCLYEYVESWCIPYKILQPKAVKFGRKLQTNTWRHIEHVCREGIKCLICLQIHIYTDWEKATRTSLFLCHAGVNRCFKRKTHISRNQYSENRLFKVFLLDFKFWSLLLIDFFILHCIRSNNVTYDQCIPLLVIAALRDKGSVMKILNKIQAIEWMLIIMQQNPANIKLMLIWTKQNHLF